MIEATLSKTVDEGVIRVPCPRSRGHATGDGRAVIPRRRMAKRAWPCHPGRMGAVVLVMALVAGSTGARGQGGEGGYLPSGGGVFVPYRSGPGGGLGVMPSGPRAMSSSVPAMSAMPGATSLGAPSGLAPLRPIGVAGGMSAGMGAVPLVNRAGAMKPMPRPPVGSYPFRIPPSLRDGGSLRPSMAM